MSGSSPETKQHVIELGAYSQVEWQVNDRLAATAGLRWDGTDFLRAPPANSAVDAAFGVRTHAASNDWKQFQPRGQLVWRLDTNTRDVVRLGAGLFTAQAPHYAEHNQLLYTGTSLADIDLRGASVPVPDFNAYRTNPSAVPGLPAGSTHPQPYVNMTGSYRAPRTTKVAAAWSHRFAESLTTTIGLHASRTRDGYHYVDLNLRATPAFTLPNENGRGDPYELQFGVRLGY